MALCLINLNCPLVTFESNPEDDDLDEEKMIRTELMNISTKSPNDVKNLFFANKI